MDKYDVLRLLKDIAEGIARTFGKNCETLIQDIEQPGHPIVVIYNGHVSGREIGSTVLLSASDTSNDDIPFIRHFVNKLVVWGDKQIKSTTFNICGEDFSYALGINYDFTALASAQTVWQDMMAVDDFLDSAIHDYMDSGHLEKIFSSCVQQIGKPISKMKKNDRIDLIRLLKEEHAFKYQKSVPFVSEKLGLSRYTIYNYLKSCDEDISASRTDGIKGKRSE